MAYEERTVKACAKINWALTVLHRRADGYHELDMLMQTISLCDTLTIAPDDKLTLAVDGAAGDADNLVLRAARALCAEAGRDLTARLELAKRIPARAGLGGGSADCAAALRALNDFWGLGLTDRRLLAIALTLGADVPFLLTGGLARVRGLGERIEPQAGARSVPLALCFVPPGLSTAAVFGAWDRAPISGARLEDAGSAWHDLRAFAAVTGNDLEMPAEKLLPAIADAKAALLVNGAIFARMTGSGSAVFGAFEREADARAAVAALGENAIFARTLPT